MLSVPVPLLVSVTRWLGDDVPGLSLPNEIAAGEIVTAGRPASSADAHGAPPGPPARPGPFSNVVPSAVVSGARPSHMPVTVAPSALVTSAADRFGNVAVHFVEPGAS